MSIELRSPVVFKPAPLDTEERTSARRAIHNAVDMSISVLEARSRLWPPGTELIQARDNLQNLIASDKLIFLSQSADVRRKYFELGFIYSPGQDGACALAMAINQLTLSPLGFTRWLHENSDAFSNTVSHLPGVYLKARQRGVTLIGAQEFLEKTVSRDPLDYGFITEEDFFDYLGNERILAEVAFDDIYELVQKVIQDHHNSSVGKAAAEFSSLVRKDYAWVLPVADEPDVRCVEAKIARFSKSPERAGICVLVNVGNGSILKMKSRNNWTQETRNAVYELMFKVPYFYKRMLSQGYQLLSARDLYVLLEKRGAKNLTLSIDLPLRDP